MEQYTSSWYHTGTAITEFFHTWYLIQITFSHKSAGNKLFLLTMMTEGGGGGASLGQCRRRPFLLGGGCSSSASPLSQSAGLFSRWTLCVFSFEIITEHFPVSIFKSNIQCFMLLHSKVPNLSFAWTGGCSGGCKGPSTARKLRSSHRPNSNSSTFLSIIELKGENILFFLPIRWKTPFCQMKTYFDFNINSMPEGCGGLLKTKKPAPST